MIRNLTLAITASAVLAPSSTAQVQAPPAEQVTGQWIVDYADNSCTARIEIELVQARWIVAIEPRPASDETLIGLVAPKGYASLEGTTFQLDGRPFKKVFKGLIEKGVTATGGRFYQQIVLPRDYAGVLASERLELKAAGKTLGFALSKIGAVQRQLDLCVKDLLSSWGYDLQQQAKIATFPTTGKPIIGYFTSEDYPRDAMWGAAGGTTTVRVNVMIDGRPEKCSVLISSGNKDLDDTTCSVILSRVRFNPAKDKAGKPVQAPSVSAVTWRAG